MPDFTRNDIDEAKRRVREMQTRAQGYSADKEKTPPSTDDKPENKNQKPFDFPGNIGVTSDSSIIIALILVLSREKADNMLILALLYILL